MLNPSAVTFKRQAWRVPALVLFGIAVCAAAFLVSSTLARQVTSRAALAPTANGDVAAGASSATDRQIGALQDRLRQEPSDQRTQTQLGLAYLQRARETSDPSYYT